MKQYGLIGNPLGHSFSKKYFTEKFENENLPDCYFEHYELKNIREISALMKEMKNLRGLAVTIPFKESVIPFVDVMDPVAAAISAINCIKIADNKLTGFNTDAIGFERSLKPLLKSHHKKALILGSGGSSKAVQYVLKKNKIPFLIVSRSHISATGCINYASLDENSIQQYPLIINCSPVGMYPDLTCCPAIPYQYLNDKNLLFDLVYEPAETQFLFKGKKQGAVVKNGFEMLVIQAEENWKIWNDL